MFNFMIKQRVADLEQHLKNAHELSAVRRKEVERLREVNESLRHKLLAAETPKPVVKGERMVGLKFNALFNGVYQPTHFKTGLGTCGKTVSYFTTNKTDKELHIFQYHDDGTRKRFDYRLADIDGRIQYDFDMVELTKEEADFVRFKRSLPAHPRAIV